MKKDIKSVYASSGILFYGVFVASFFSWHLGLAGAVLVPLAVVGVLFLVYEKEFTYPAAITAMVLSGALLFCTCLFVSLAARMLQQTWVFPAMMFAGNACIVMGLVGTIVLGSVYLAAEEPNFTPQPLL